MKRPLGLFVGTVLYLALALLAALGSAGLMYGAAWLAGAGGESAGAWISGHLLLGSVLMWVLLVPSTILWARFAGDLDSSALGLRGPAVGAAVGIALGLGMILVPAGFGLLLGAYDGGGSGSTLGGVALTALGLGAAAFGEELVFRGWLLPFWARRLGPRGALVATAFAFTAVHTANPGASLLGVMGVLLAGLLLGTAWLVTRSLWLPVGIHWGWNAATSVVLGLPLSGLDLPSALELRPGAQPWMVGLFGGDFGPEEGLAYHAALAAALVVVLVVGPRLGGQPSPSSR